MGGHGRRRDRARAARSRRVSSSVTDFETACALTPSRTRQRGDGAVAGEQALHDVAVGVAHVVEARRLHELLSIRAVMPPATARASSPTSAVGIDCSGSCHHRRILNHGCVYWSTMVEDLAVLDDALAVTRQVVWCVLTTVDTKGRPRNRVVHPVWVHDDGGTDRAALRGWVTTRRSPVKAAHLAANPHVACAYSGAEHDVAYFDCTAAWASPEERRHAWEVCRSVPSPRRLRPRHDLARRPRRSRCRGAAPRSLPRPGGSGRRPRAGRRSAIWSS